MIGYSYAILLYKNSELRTYEERPTYVMYVGVEAVAAL
jgi:hypothetical protein